LLTGQGTNSKIQKRNSIQKNASRKRTTRSRIKSFKKSQGQKEEVKFLDLG